MSVRIGLECCLEDPPAVLAGRRFGLLMNQASVDSEFRFAHDLLHQRFKGQLKALFGPQHGLWSEQQDNMIETPHGRDARLDIPVYSLYSGDLRPAPEMLDDLELLVVDLQDVGVRVYTFVWTLSYCMQACAARGIPVLVLDRPNPLGGEVVEGPDLDPAFASFVGRAPIPMRHAMTIAELALYLDEVMGIGAEVHVVPMQGWRRHMLFPDTGRTWVPPSPNLPRIEGALLYPGQVLIEGTRLSEGRGTTTPFEVFGAPFIDPYALIEHLGPHDGVALRPVRFEPTFQKHAGSSCGGLYLHPTDPRALRSYRLTLAILGAIRDLWPGESVWLPPPYEYETERQPFDILSGSDEARQVIDEGLTPASLHELCRPGSAPRTLAEYA